MVVVHPHQIAVFVAFQHCLGERLVSGLVCFELRVGSGDGFDGERNVVEQRPQQIVAETVVAAAAQSGENNKSEMSDKWQTLLLPVVTWSVSRCLMFFSQWIAYALREKHWFAFECFQLLGDHLTIGLPANLSARPTNPTALHIAAAQCGHQTTGAVAESDLQKRNKAITT